MTMKTTDKVTRLKSIAQSIIDCTIPCNLPMPWMVKVTDEQRAACALHKISDLLALAQDIVER
jgi:hypothetical protein